MPSDLDGDLSFLNFRMRGWISISYLRARRDARLEIDYSFQFHRALLRNRCLSDIYYLPWLAMVSWP